MERVLPSSFLFRYAIPVHFDDGVGRNGLSKWDFPDDFTLPGFQELDGLSPFAVVKLAWNYSGLAVSVEVDGKRRSPRCDVNLPTESEGVQVWIDTRDTQTIHRAGRFCHHFCLLPVGGGKSKTQPLTLQLPIARAREDPPLVEAGAIPTASKVGKTGYRLDAWFPVEALNGFDPESSSRLGFFYCVRDADLGDQTLTVGPEFPFAHDPSLWSTLQLQSD